MIERIEGSPEFADAEIKRRRDAGHSSAYLFAAKTDDLPPFSLPIVTRISSVGSYGQPLFA
jgi:hypothetical protein